MDIVRRYTEFRNSIAYETFKPPSNFETAIELIKREKHVATCIRLFF